MVLRSVDITDGSLVGVKARTLAVVQQAGYNVPNFIALSPEDLKNVFTHPVIENEQLVYLQKKVVKLLPVARYAVRSSAFTEDGLLASSAGQFHTVLNVAAVDIPKAILDVCLQATAKLDSDEDFSIIVQEFIAPDRAGIIFSRCPLGGQEIVIEFVAGVGEAAVGGRSVERITCLPHQALLHKSELSCVEELVTISRQLEILLGYPQDIEWAMKDGQLYILQSRPITSLSKDQWYGLKYLDEELKDETDYVYESTTLAETFAQPRPLAYSILSQFYQKTGPIEQAYQQIGVKYTATHQLHQFGNAVYVDRQAETQSLFPAYGYLKHQSAVPRVENFLGLITSLRNSLALARLSLGQVKKAQSLVDEILKAPLLSSDTLSARWEILLQAYPEIFLISLRTQKSFVKLERLLPKNSAVLGGLVSGPFSVGDEEVRETEQVTFKSEGLRGNSISIDDVSLFVMSAQTVEKLPAAELSNWWQSLPQWKRHGLLPHIKTARRYIMLREQARWASVRLIDHLRQAVEEYGRSKIPYEPGLIYYATIDELLREEVELERLKKRQLQYMQNQHISFPNRIASFFPAKTAAIHTNQGLSPGQASGALVTIDTINSTSGPKILYTKVLSPDLTKCLSQVSGIITEQGGLLSHMAIVAREACVPAVQTKTKLTPGTNVKINGADGTVVVISK